MKQNRKIQDRKIYLYIYVQMSLWIFSFNYEQIRICRKFFFVIQNIPCGA